jgi:hypothetical protein
MQARARSCNLGCRGWNTTNLAHRSFAFGKASLWVKEKWPNMTESKTKKISVILQSVIPIARPVDIKSLRQQRGVRSR